MDGIGTTTAAGPPVDATFLDKLLSNQLSDAEVRQFGKTMHFGIWSVLISIAAVATDLLACRMRGYGVPLNLSVEAGELFSLSNWGGNEALNWLPGSEASQVGTLNWLFSPGPRFAV